MNYTYDYTDPCIREVMLSKVAKSHALTHRLSYHTYDNARVLPLRNIRGETFVGGVVTQSGEFIHNTGFHNKKEGFYEISSNQFERIEKPTIYLGYFSKVWGHCITDNLKLLWFVLTPEYKKLTAEYGYQPAFLCSPDFILVGQMKSLLEALGVDVISLYRIDMPTVFSALVVPEGSFIANNNLERFYSSEYKTTIDHIVSRLTLRDVMFSKPKYEKVFLSRSRYSNRFRDKGEKALEKAFRKMGYTIVYPERLSLQEQITLYQHCSTLATTEGSVSHNAVFLREGTTLIIVRKVPFVNDYQIAINEMRNLNVTYIDANLSVFVDVEAPATGPFFVYINDNMVRFSKGILKNDFSITRFRNYANSALLLPHFERRIKMPDYYYTKLSEEIIAKENCWRSILQKLPISNKIKNTIKLIGKWLLR